MLKICIVTHSYPRFKGDWSSNFIESLALAYVRNGADVTVLVPFSERYHRTPEDMGGVKIVTYQYMPFDSLHTFGYGHSMKQDLKMNFGDMLLTPFIIMMGAIKLSALLKEENFDLIHAHWAIPNTLIAMLARYFTRSRARIFTAFPGSDVSVITLLGWFGRILAKLIATSDYLSCDGSDLRDDLVKAGLEENTIDLVIYGVDENRIHFSEESRNNLRERFGISKNDLVLLMIGRFVPKKGFSTGFLALKLITDRIKNIKMIVVGDGALKDEYLAIIKKESLSPFVIFPGSIPLEELSEYYSACDIFLMPSRKLPAHGLNVVVVEAMACGRPVVASDIGGNRLVVFNGTNGYLHQENNPSQLADLVITLAENPDLRKEMGQTSLKLVNERFNWDAIAQYYIHKYLEIDKSRVASA